MLLVTIQFTCIIHVAVFICLYSSSSPFDVVLVVHGSVGELYSHIYGMREICSVYSLN